MDQRPLDVRNHPVRVSSEGGRVDSIEINPDKHGFAGAFAGVSHGSLIVAGGANFPDKKPWEGGTKVWYDSVYVLDRPDGEWQVAGRLRRPLGYGVSVTHGNGLICVGGGNSTGHFADVFRLEWMKDRLVESRLPSLPVACANACGDLVGSWLYVAGGQASPTSAMTLKTVFRIDLSAIEPEWQAVDPIPGGGRMLSVAASFGGKFWVVGGVDLIQGTGGNPERRYLTDGWCHAPQNGWSQMARLPHAVTAAPSPAPIDATGFLVLGGDDGSQLGIPHERHRGFVKTVLHYDAAKNLWTDVGQSPVSRVTVPCVHWEHAWIIPSGEMKPAIRSPEVWSFTPDGKK